MMTIRRLLREWDEASDEMRVALVSLACKAVAFALLLAAVLMM